MNVKASDKRFGLLKAVARGFDGLMLNELTECLTRGLVLS